MPLHIAAGVAITSGYTGNVLRRLALIPFVLLIPPLVHADSVLIVPFFNGSGTASLDWIGESVAETVREAFASQGMIALSRDDREEAYRRLQFHSHVTLTLASVIRLGQALDADQVIYGEFELKPGPPTGAKTRGTLTITARVLDLKQSREGPKFSEVGALEDLAVLQRHLAWQTLALVAPGATPAEADFDRRNPVVRADAIESYIRGLLASPVEEKRKLFGQALRLNPGYSEACFELGRLNFGAKDYRSAADWLQKVAPESVAYNEATFILGLSRYYMGDFAGAETAFHQVAANVPLNEVVNDLGAAQSRRNEISALENFQKALDGDTSDPVYQFNTGYALWKQGSYAAAADRFRAVLERDPEDEQAPLLLARCLKGSGPRRGEQTQGLERLKTNYEESAWFQLKAILQQKKP
jgi:tetratricopeptide (TPR) repeat protein